MKMMRMGRVMMSKAQSGIYKWNLQSAAIEVDDWEGVFCRSGVNPDIPNIGFTVQQQHQQQLIIPFITILTK